VEIKFVKSAKCGKGRIEKIKKGGRQVGKYESLKAGKERKLETGKRLEE
jgi:hypothetical protein